MRKLAFWVLLALVGGFALDAAAQDEGTKGIRFHQNESWDEMLKLAQKEDKMIFMDCYTVWCGPCKALARDIFPQEKVGDFFNPRFINVQYDMEKGDGKMLYDKYKKYIVGFPTLLLLDKNGNVLQQMAGYHEADDLIEGMLRMMSTEKGFTGPVNIGNPSEFTILELAQLVLDISGSKSKIIFKELPSDDPKRRKPDIGLARRKLHGWEPRVPLREGLARTIEYFKTIV